MIRRQRIDGRNYGVGTWVGPVFCEVEMVKEKLAVALAAEVTKRARGLDRDDYIETLEYVLDLIGESIHAAQHDKSRDGAS